MASVTDITLRAGESQATDIVLRDLPVADATAESVMWLYPIAAPSTPAGEPTTITMRAGESSPTDIVLSIIETFVAGPIDVIITLHDLLSLEGAITPPAVTYYGVLNRWTGAAWVKAKLMRYAGSWADATMRRWDGDTWRLINNSAT